MSYTVEIFSDYDAHEEIDISPALAGIAIIGAYSSMPETIITGNKMKVTKESTPDIVSGKIRWPRRLQADVGIVLTDRDIQTNLSVNALSSSRISGTARLAVVSTEFPDAVVAEVTAHEFGHLVGVHTSNFTTHNHCDNQHCIMHETVLNTVDYIKDSTTLFRKVRTLLGIPKMVEELSYIPTVDFCDVCAATLAKQIGNLSTKSTS